MLGSCQFLRYVTPEPCGNWERTYIRQNAGTDENEDTHNNINNKLYRPAGSMAIKLPERNQGCPNHSFMPNIPKFNNFVL